MPGMVECHSHLSIVDVARGTAPGELPPEDHTLLTMDAACKLLAAGFTSACSAAAAKILIDVAIRDAIEDRLIDSPRLLAAGAELTVTGGLGDGRKLHLRKGSTRSSSTFRAISAPPKHPPMMQDNRRFSFAMKGGVGYLPCRGAPHLRRLHQEIG
jgi:imidazolonepropionase-like amidohydrolase